MRRDSAKLRLRKDTLRRLDPVPDDQLRRVAGGTYVQVSWVPDDSAQAGRSATGSANCRF